MFIIFLFLKATFDNDKHWYVDNAQKSFDFCSNILFISKIQDDFIKITLIDYFKTI